MPIAGLPDDDFLAIRRNRLELVEKYKAEPLRDSSSVASKSKEDQERAMVIQTR